MTAFVLGLVVWKAIDARNTALARSERDIRNLAHSLSEQASTSILAADIAMSGIVDLLKYRRPEPERLNQYLRNTIRALPQIREMGVLDASGTWIYSSLDELPAYNNADRDYFTYHRDSPDPGLRINNPLQSRLTGRRTIVLSRRISNQDGSFGGVLTAAIDTGFFGSFYGAFNLGPHAAITLLRNDGVLLARWPESSWTMTTATSGFKAETDAEPSGFFKSRSPFDGYMKYFGFEHASQYPIFVTVALTEDELLAEWRQNLRRDAIVAAILMCSVILLAALLTAQFRARSKAERDLREREAHYRLLADNSADVVVLLDREGTFRFVSQSVETVLGLKPESLLGRPCFEFVHPDDLQAVQRATAELTDWTISKTVVFKTWRSDGAIAWIEINFKLAGANDEHRQVEVVGSLRDVTTRKMMEDELNALNTRLEQLATTDGLTGLANRRTFDVALRREFSHRRSMSVIMLDIDNFKGFNDNLGHQAGDECLRRVAGVIARTRENSPVLAARYGGEEFGIILPDVGEQDALKLAEAIRANVLALAIANPASNRGLTSVSLGVASRTGAISDELDLVAQADRALYAAKHQGRNCSVLASTLAQDHAASPPLSPAEPHDPAASHEAAQSNPS
jgi:diguanylate cyclase (GGDEF)-like protein/PAS domain S-box-containing protein